MLITTEALALRAIKYSDSSRVVKLYTRQLGIQSFLVQGLHRPKSRITVAHFQPLTALEVVAYHKPGGALQRLREVRMAAPAEGSLFFDVGKSALAMFLSELAYQCVQEEEPNDHLFAWLKASAAFIRSHDGGWGLFPHWLMTHFTRFLGFFPLQPPAQASDVELAFDLEEGAFVPESSNPRKSMAPDMARSLKELLHAERRHAVQMQLPLKARRQLLQRLIRYYQLQHPGFQSLRTTEVLEQLQSA